MVLNDDGLVMKNAQRKDGRPTLPCVLDLKMFGLARCVERQNYVCRWQMTRHIYEEGEQKGNCSVLVQWERGRGDVFDTASCAHPFSRVFFSLCFSRCFILEGFD